MEFITATNELGKEFDIICGTKTSFLSTSVCMLKAEQDFEQTKEAKSIKNQLEFLLPFNVFVNLSLDGTIESADWFLKYIQEHKNQIVSLFESAGHSNELYTFLDEFPNVIEKWEIPNHVSIDKESFAQNEYSRIKNKYFFLLDKNNVFQKVNFSTIAELFGMEKTLWYCRQFDFIYGMGFNGKMFWTNGLGIKEKGLDTLSGGIF